MNRTSNIASYSAFCAALLLAGCHGKQGTQEAPAAASDGKPMPIDGYGQVKLGTSLDGMISQLGRDFFHPKFIDDCVANLATQGCFIAQNPDHAAYTTIEGNPFRLVSSFNTKGKLTDLKLMYRQAGDTSLDQCRTIYEKTLDWATATYGKFYIDGGAADTRFKTMTTPKGNSYNAGEPIAQVFASAPLYTVPVQTTDRGEKPAINQRYAWPMVLFTGVGEKPVCQVALYLSEPDSIERRPDASSRM